MIIEKNQSGASSGSEAGTVSSMRILRTSTNVKRKFQQNPEDKIKENSVIKTLRAFRALRTLKTLALVRGAQVIFAAILRSQVKLQIQPISFSLEVMPIRWRSRASQSMSELRTSIQ